METSVLWNLKTLLDERAFHFTCISVCLLQGSQCCFLDMKDFKGVSSTLTLASDVASCEAFCLSASTFCMAVTYSLNVCYIYTTLPSVVTANSQSTYSVKVCPAGKAFLTIHFCFYSIEMIFSLLHILYTKVAF